jgi:hypothetical protein
MLEPCQRSRGGRPTACTCTKNSLRATRGPFFAISARQETLRHPFIDARNKKVKPIASVQRSNETITKAVANLTQEF